MEGEVNTRPPGLRPSRFPSTAKERCEQVFFAGVGSSRIDGVPLEADVSRNVERFRAGRCDSNDPSLPMPNAVAEIDGLGRWKAATDHEARVQKRIFESVAKFRVAHSITSRSSIVLIVVANLSKPVLQTVGQPSRQGYEYNYNRGDCGENLSGPIAGPALVTQRRAWH